MSNNPKAKLILEDGAVFQGYSFGKADSVSGEVVFNTAMTGYTESLTDPSYSGQILVATYPLIGNYGVPPATEEAGLPRFFESYKIHIKALVVSDYSFKYSHWNAAKSLHEWLQEYNVPAIFGVDTREITKIIRNRGVMSGKVVTEGVAEPSSYVDPNAKNLVAEVSCTKPTTYGSGKHKVVLVDCGSKYNIVRCLLARDTTVTCVPWNYDFSQLDYDGVMLSNGPGDPQMCVETIANIKKAIAKGKPIFGICLGHQLLSIAAGASTFKLKYGHRSHNQPALILGTNRAVITSQNHGYAVDDKSLPEAWEPYCINLNDNTNEGIRHKSKPFFSVQFHPEATGGPTDTEFLFDEFIQKMEQAN